MKPYELTGSRTLYVSVPTEDKAYAAAKKLLRAARERNEDPTSLSLSIQWTPADDKEPAYFAASITVND